MYGFLEMIKLVNYLILVDGFIMVCLWSFDGGLAVLMGHGLFVIACGGRQFRLVAFTRLLKIADHQQQSQSCPLLFSFIKQPLSPIPIINQHIL